LLFSYDSFGRIVQQRHIRPTVEQLSQLFIACPNTPTFSVVDSGSQLITQSSTLTFAHDGKGSVRALFGAAAARYAGCFHSGKRKSRLAGMRAAILEQNQKQGIPSPRAEHKAKLLALGILSGNGPNLLAEMRRRSAGADEHPGRSAQQHAMFASVQTGRLAPNRYY
jgi:hypothetical protein